MKIALDYDGTFTNDQSLWLNFIHSSLDHGHSIFIVTFRSKEDEDETLTYLSGFIPVYYTAGVAKKWWCGHFGPGSVDVWIDDKPETIIENSYLSPNEVVAWREGLDLSA